MTKYKIVISVVFIFSLTQIYAQNDLPTDLDALRLAYQNVKEGDYEKAFPYFEKMLKKYPKDPTYNYYVGVCNLFMEKDPANALKYLRFASTKDVSVEIWYYLGLAYLKDYQFEQALDNFLKFEKIAGKPLKRKINIANYISMAQNGLYLTRYIKEPTVYSKKSALCDNFYLNYQANDLEGQFVDYYEYFKLKRDSVTKKSFMFVPKRVENQDVFYFSAKNKKRGDYDIYRIFRVNDSEWGEPENLGDVINTPFDEDFPYMHADGSTLYFASKGHYSMGGYDLYKSTWNWDMQQWTEPENLDFPINSPFNDFLFVPTANKRFAFFASDRGANGSDCFVYKIKLNNSDPYISVQGHAEMIKYAALNVNSTSGKIENENKQADKQKSESAEYVKLNAGKNFLYKNEYDSLINHAINYQLKADSLKWLIDEKRAVFDITKEGKDRLLLGNKIVEKEQEVYALQKKADKCYERVRQIEQQNLALNKTNDEQLSTVKNENIKKDPVVEKAKDQKMYVQPEIDSIVKSKLKFESAEPEMAEPANRNYGFKIELPSVYNKKNPIPVNEKLPGGVVYMIQLGAFSSEKDPSVFKGLTPLTAIVKANSNVRKYFTGKFQTSDAAEKALPIVKGKGFKDAYVVAFYNGAIMPINKALELESKPATINEGVANKEVKGKAEELSIVYVLKSKLAVTDTLLIGEIKKMLPDGLEIFNETKDGILLIKSFPSYEKAFELQTKIGTDLKKDFEIHAYFAEDHIPLEQARKIAK